MTQPFGVRPSGYRLPEPTRLGPVTLQVADLERSIDWYHAVLGFHASSLTAGGATLTTDGSDHVIIELVERPGARPAGVDKRLGLFHYAILVPRRAVLAAFAQHLGDVGVEVAASDHLVSEAFYLSDPDGLGIEVYADRPRESWKIENGELAMTTEPIDLPGLLAAVKEPWSGMPAGTKIGHMHLHVGDITKASAFYSDAIGFDRIVTRYPGALFMSAGGYHHHLGTNTWAGPTAREPRDDDARLIEWTIVVPSVNDVDEVEASLRRAGATVKREGPSLVASDPWETQLRLRAV